MIKDKNTFSSIVKIHQLKKTEIWIIRFLICCGMLSMVLFILWFVNPEHVGWQPIYWLLTLALFFKLGKMIHEWYHYWSVSIPPAPLSTKVWKVDVLTTACPGEPQEMIIRTLKAMVKIKYPHTNYLCDEGDDQILKNICNELGVIHVTRKEKIDAKAGNINNALKQATGDICVVLDPDHQPIEEFLDRVLPYFEDDKIGFVQCVQGYSNQSESFIAKGAAEQTYHFYGPMMMSMNTYGTVQAIGANCTFRRKALDSIGGHAAGLSEDMHTAMQLHAKGWKSLYIPEVLTRGLVPATLSAYYKQQLKWSRGTFELLFRTYPILFKKFTWRQKIHYLTIPMYFLLGLVNFIDILIPLLALCFAQVPWEINLGDFALFFFPLCGLSLIIRLYAQRWLLEKHEIGFHMAGGLLRTASWWIFLIGFLYTIFKIKVPYIPTPKEEAHQNYWKLSIPNISVLIICVAAVSYGLSIDWTPYSIAMAFYCLINAAMLAFIVVISQQSILLSINKFVKKIPVVYYFLKGVEKIILKTQNVIYKLLKNSLTAMLLAISLIFVGYNNQVLKTNGSIIFKEKEFGGFYFGMPFLKKENDFKTIESLEKSFSNTCDIVSFDESWGKKNESFPENLLERIKEHGSIPMINWQPDFNSYPENYKVFRAITWGIYDSYLKNCAASLRKFKGPVFINFASGFDNPDNSWSVIGNNTPEEFIKAWQHIYIYFNELGISNVTWVWCPNYPSSTYYYPGSKFVDWIGVSCLNYGKNLRDKNWVSFSELYQPFKKTLCTFQKPIMLLEFGTIAGENQSLWLNSALIDIKNRHHEIRSLIIRNDQKSIIKHDKRTADTSLFTVNFVIKTPETLKTLATNFKKEPFSKKPFFKNYPENTKSEYGTYKSKFINGAPGKFKLISNGKPYYIIGVAYNTAHDWRDGNMPLTRRQVEKDFEKIKAMGANTIRRYDNGFYDKNVLHIAKEYDLKVMYGFWFDPQIDYYRDTLRVKEYIKNVEEKVMAYKDYPSILSWSLGNETWGLLKNTYSKPYLVQVRNSYIKLIELLSKRVHELDPNHPIFIGIEHLDYELPGELAVCHDCLPSIDVIGINSYYREQISELNKVTHQFDSLRPYLISEFGPRGYWDSDKNRILKSQLIEDSETEKANWYKHQWINYVVAFKGYNIGGFAYCWHDRMEGTYTWFGLTDYKGRLKPSYYALKEVWTKEKQEPIPQFDIKPTGIKGDKQYSYTAISRSGKKDDFTYEWYLHKDEYLNLERINNVEYSSDGCSVKVKVPDDSLGYRLYLYVSDNKGNVSTSSVPIPLRKNVRNSTYPF